MLRISNDLSAYTLAAGEPFIMEVQLLASSGAATDINDHSLVLSFYNSRTRALVERIEGERLADTTGEYFRWARDGTFSEGLIDSDPLTIELARRYTNGRQVIGQGALTITRTSPTIDSLAGVGIGDVAVRASIKANANLGVSPQITIEYIPYAAAVPPTPPSFLTNPSIQHDGTPIVGETLTGVDGTVAGGTIQSRSWLFNGSAISGANGGTYVPTQAGQYSFGNVANGTGGSVSAVSTAVTVSAAPAPTPTPSDYTAHIVMIGDSLGNGSYSNGFKSIENLGYTNTTVNNRSVDGKTLTEFVTDVQGGAVDSQYTSAKPCVAVIEAGTNDLFGGATDGNGLYTKASTLIALLKDKGFYVVIQTLFPRNISNSTQQGYRTTYNNLVRANSGGADLVIDMAGDAVIGDGTGFSATYWADGTHLNQAGQQRVRDIYKMAGNLPTQLSKAPRAPAPPPAGGNIDPLTGSGVTYTAGKFGQARSVGNLIVPGSISPAPLVRGKTFQGWFRRDTAPTGLEVIFGISDQLYVSWSGSGLGGTIGSAAITTGAWHHIVLECATDATRIYLDGAVAFATGGAGVSPNALLHVGHLNGGFNFGGLIDQFEVYDGAKYGGTGFTPPTAPVAAGAANLLGAWSLDGNLTGYK